MDSKGNKLWYDTILFVETRYIAMGVGIKAAIRAEREKNASRWPKNFGIKLGGVVWVIVMKEKLHGVQSTHWQVELELESYNSIRTLTRSRKLAFSITKTSDLDWHGMIPWGTTADLFESRIESSQSHGVEMYPRNEDDGDGHEREQEA